MGLPLYLTSSVLHTASDPASMAEAVSSAQHLEIANGKTPGVVPCLVRVEDLTHNRVRGIGALRCWIAQLTGNLAALRREIDLLGHLFIVQIALDVFPALHLRENPHGHGVPGKRVEIDAVGHFLDVPEPIGIAS